MKNIYLRTLALVLLVLSSHFISAQCTSSTTYQQATTCQGQPYTFYGTSLDTAGTYNDTITLVGGCDSIISLQLFVIPILYVDVYDTMCAGGTFVFGPYTLTAAGTYTDTFYYGSYFCDSVTILHLAIGSPHNDTFYNSVTYCTPARGGGGGGRGYNFYGRNLTASGIYTHVGGSLPGSTSCSDSVIILSLTVGAAPVTVGVAPGGFGGFGTPDTVRTCSSSYTFDGRTYTTDGNYADTIISSIGCDSVLTYFTLLLNSGYTSALVTGSSCAGAPFIWRGHSYAGPGGAGGGRPVNYYDTIVAAGGCDTIYTITVSRGFPNAPINVVDSFCAGSSYVYAGDTFTTAGYDTLSVPSTTGGCPTTVYLHLTYKAAPTSLLVDSFCQGSSYSFRGHTYTTSGLHFFTVPSPAGGCDSMIEVNLSYITAPTINIVDSFCQGTSYTYRGNTYTTAGLHSITYPSPSGCDTVVNLNLSFKAVPIAFINATICQGTWYVYDGIDSFNTRGFHRFTTSVPGSCDTTITLILTVTAAPRDTVTGSFCVGDTFYYLATAYSTPGTYTVLKPAAVGCDTNVTLILSYKPVAATPTITQAANVLVVNPLVANIQWYLNGSPIAGATSQTYIATQSGVYSVTESPAGVCSATSANDTVVGVGINELTGGDLFTIYPNPSNGKFTLETTQYNGTEIAIYDVLGRAVYQAPLLSSKQSIDMSGATNGTYYLVLKNQHFTRYAHFVIAR